MLKIARWTMAHRRIVVLGWIAVAIGVYGISSSVGAKTASNFRLPGTGSQHAVDLLKRSFPAQAGDSDQIVLRARSGKLTDAGKRTAVGSMLARVSRMPHVTGVVSPYGGHNRAVSRDGTRGGGPRCTP